MMIFGKLCQEGDQIKQASFCLGFFEYAYFMVTFIVFAPKEH